MLKKRNITPEQWIMYAGAKQIAIELPEKLTKRDLKTRYNLDFSPDEGGENSGYDYFWSSDLRSACGIMDEDYDMHGLILFPYWYAKHNAQEFKRLLEEAESLRPEWGDEVSGAISSVRMPALP